MNSGNKNGDLQSLYEFNSVWADRIARLIILGLAVDIAIVFIFGKSWSEAVLTIIADTLIIAGVWGELWFEKRAKVAGDGIVALANARAAEATQKAEEARLELARYRAPRTLLPPQQNRVAEKVRRFSGVQFDAATALGDAEALGLLEMIEAAVLAAGWIMIDWSDVLGLPGTSIVAHRPGRRRLGNTSIEGVVVQFEVEQRSRLEAAANALASALVAEEIPAVALANMQGTITAANTMAIHILVGPKA